VQEKTDTLENFLRRTDRLAEVLKKQIGELPPVVGMSRASLFGYRSGKRPLTIKAFRKLEEAEKVAGIAGNEVESPGAPASLEQRMLEQFSSIKVQLDRIEAAVCKPEKRK
jgi:hypothetical protein